MPQSDVASAGAVLGVTTRSAGNMKDPSLRATALSAAGLGRAPAYFLKQVHGADVVRVGPSTPTDVVPEADGWITDLSERALCVFVADCVPLFVWEKSGRAVGVFHSGWRGTAAGMPREAVAAFQRFYGIAPENLAASIGPHIGSCCYRVGPELEGRFAAGSFRREGESLYLDLTAEVRAQLEASGVPAASVAASAGCTSCEPEQFFSFRRDKQDCRMMAYAALKGPTR